MHILLYEHFTGGGLWTDAPQATCLDHRLLDEAAAMAGALADDLSRLADVHLVRFQDARWPSVGESPAQVVTVENAEQEAELLEEWSARVDATVLIAPEMNHRLLDLAQRVERCGGRLLSPDSRFIELASDKHRTAQWLSAAGVAVPESVVVEAGARLPAVFAYPGVWKPVDGVGSVDVDMVADGDEAVTRLPRGVISRLERFCPGMAASVLGLCGPRGTMLLPPCGQRLSDDGRFHYLGGELPLEPGLARRACQLARAAFAALPRTTGLVGIDVILGPDEEGRQDVVLDVNPRLTTSYVGVRQAAVSNLAAAMLAVARGETTPLFLHACAVEFEADGRVTQPTCSL